MGSAKRKRLAMIEVLRMNVEFHIDDFGQVWLFNADNIWIREKNELN